MLEAVEVELTKVEPLEMEGLEAVVMAVNHQILTLLVLTELQILVEAVAVPLLAQVL